MKIAITLAYIGFFPLTLAADGSDFSCDDGKVPGQLKPLAIDTTFCSDTGIGKAFQRNYTQGAEKCCDLKYACLQICGIDEEQCNKFGIVKGGLDCDASSRCKKEQQDKVDACQGDFEILVSKTQLSFQREEPCTCVAIDRREKKLKRFAEANDVPDCLHVNYLNNTEVAEWFLKIIKKKVIGTNVCEISRHKFNSNLLSVNEL